MLANKIQNESTLYRSGQKLFYYQAYGMNICSEFELPELSSGSGVVDLTIRKGVIENMPSEAVGAYSYYKARNDGIYLAWDGVGAFKVKDGCDMIVQPQPGVEERIIRLFILGTALAMVLHQRGDSIVLHASVVDVSGSAVAFVGEKGAGKSTLAGTLHKMGYDLIADDILSVKISRGRAEALPGFPHLKLWPDSAESLGCSPSDLPRLRPELEKRSLRLKDGFANAAVPLHGIYIIDDGSHLAIEKLQPQEALLALMPHWYGARFGVDFLQKLGLGIHFRQCTKLANWANIYRLTRPRSLKEVVNVAGEVVNHTKK